MICPTCGEHDSSTGSIGSHYQCKSEPKARPPSTEGRFKQEIEDACSAIKMIVRNNPHDLRSLDNRTRQLRHLCTGLDVHARDRAEASDWVQAQLKNLGDAIFPKVHELKLGRLMARIQSIQSDAENWKTSL